MAEWLSACIRDRGLMVLTYRAVWQGWPRNSRPAKFINSSQKRSETFHGGAKLASRCGIVTSLTPQASINSMVVLAGLSRRELELTGLSQVVCQPCRL